MSALDAFCRVRSALDGREVTLWWSGSVFAFGPDIPYQKLFTFEGVNVSRLVAIDGGYELLAREAAFYGDPRTGEILDAWHNPFTNSKVDVIHVWNDPANQRLLENGPRGPFHLPTTELGGQTCYVMEIPLSYPSPLAGYAENSADDTYRALELFQFYASTRAAQSAEPSVPHVLSWMRQSPWLPWMRMGQRPGGLTFHCRGRKLESYVDTPAHVRDYIARHQPQFAHAPDTWSEPNETSWTYFRKLSLRG